MRGIPGLLLVAMLLAAPASAQVTVNPGALDLLPAPRPARPAPRPAARPAPPRPAAATRPATPVASTAPPAPVTPTPRPVIPVVPPAIAALPPPAPVPPPRPMPAPLIPVTADAPGAATPLPGGLRVTFGPDRQDLNPTTEAALRALARTLRANDTATINVFAYAAGSPEDPSTARRLALARALAARAVLINEGIASPRIYPRALGPTGGDAGADRVDVVAGPPGPPPPTPPPTVPAPGTAPIGIAPPGSSVP